MDLVTIVLLILTILFGVSSAYVGFQFANVSDNSFFGTLFLLAFLLVGFIASGISLLVATIASKKKTITNLQNSPKQNFVGAPLAVTLIAIIAIVIFIYALHL